MLKRQKIKFIRKKCIEVNPEIAELKIGCKVLWKTMDEEFIFINDIDEQCKKPKYYYLYSEEGKYFTLYKWDNKEWEIIGRPIRLADIIYMLKEVSTMGTDYYEKEKQLITNLWDLKHNDLEKQKEETIDFIYKLLKKNKYS